MRMRRANRLIAVGVLCVMALGAAVSLTFALYSQPERRANDTRMPHKPRGPNLTESPPAPSVTAPVAMEALRWLPADSNIVAGVQVADLRQTEAGRDLLNHLASIGKIEVDAGLLERWTGLRLEEIDHLVLGVRVNGDFPPRAVLVIRTVLPYNPDAVRKTLEAERLPDANGKTLYKFKQRDGGLAPILWCADDRTLVFGLLARQIEAVPAMPAAGLERLPVEVRTLLENRLQTPGPAWVVGYAADWRKTAAAVLFPEKAAALLGQIHSLRRTATSGEADDAVGFVAMRQRRRRAATGKASAHGEAGAGRRLEGGARRFMADASTARRPGGVLQRPG